MDKKECSNCIYKNSFIKTEKAYKINNEIWECINNNTDTKIINEHIKNLMGILDNINLELLENVDAITTVFANLLDSISNMEDATNNENFKNIRLNMIKYFTVINSKIKIFLDCGKNETEYFESERWIILKQLSNREKEIYNLLLNDKKPKEIQNILHISKTTYETYFNRLKEKINKIDKCESIKRSSDLSKEKHIYL